MMIDIMMKSILKRHYPHDHYPFHQTTTTYSVLNDNENGILHTNIVILKLPTTNQTKKNELVSLCLIYLSLFILAIIISITMTLFCISRTSKKKKSLQNLHTIQPTAFQQEQSLSRPTQPPQTAFTSSTHIHQREPSFVISNSSLLTPFTVQSMNASTPIILPILQKSLITTFSNHSDTKFSNKIIDSVNSNSNAALIYSKRKSSLLVKCKENTKQDRFSSQSFQSIISAISSSNSIAIETLFGRIKEHGKEVVFNLDNFTSACLRISVLFDTSVFFKFDHTVCTLKTLTTPQTIALNENSPNCQITLVSVQKALIAAGLEGGSLSREQVQQLLEILFGNIKLGIQVLKNIHDAYSDGLDNVELLLLYYYQWTTMTELFFDKLEQIDPRIRFDLKGFESACLKKNKRFRLRVFVEEMFDYEEIELEQQVHSLLMQMGVTLTKEEFEGVMDVLCGGYEFSLSVLNEWIQVLKDFGVDGIVIMSFV